MRSALIVASVTLLTALPALGQETLPFACEGPFGKRGSHDMLVAEFGANNVVFTQIYGPEATFPMASVVYPQDPARRLAVVWQDEIAKATPGYVLIDEESLWTVSGVRTGMSMIEVEVVNGGPFSLGGFNDVDRGMVFDWNGGAVKTDLSDCFIMVTFTRALFGAPLDLDDAVQGEGAYRSDEPVYKALAPRVRSIVATYPIAN